MDRGSWGAPLEYYNSRKCTGEWRSHRRKVHVRQDVTSSRSVFGFRLIFCLLNIKNSTIPIAKRRYYGRVQQGVHEFLAMGPDIVKGDMAADSVQHFFDVEGTLIVPAKRKDVNGQCTKKDGDCRGKEIRDSRYNDMVRMIKLVLVFHTRVHERAMDFLHLTNANMKPHDKIESKRLSARKRLSYGSTKAPRQASNSKSRQSVVQRNG